MTSGLDEDQLRKQLRQYVEKFRQKDHIEPTYKRLLLNNSTLASPPMLCRDKFYRKIPSRLRETVERYVSETRGKDPMDRIAQRQPLQDSAMMASFTLREAKEHEQKALLDATLTSFPKIRNMDEAQRKRYCEEIALGLQNKRPRKAQTEAEKAVEQTERAQEEAELEAQRAAFQSSERKRQRREEEERRRRELESRRIENESAQEATRRFMREIFDPLWDMSFGGELAGQNPFRTVIDRSNCAYLAPGYCDIIEKPMNLTYIQKKIEESVYENMKGFFDDCELMLSNALEYNKDKNSPYRKAALEMGKKYKKMKKQFLERISQR